jgi:hypothetical protein
VAEEQKPESNISPAPADVAPTPGAAQPVPVKTPDKPTSGPQPDPLSDGTVPTVLSAGESHKSVPKGSASITSVYRKADIMTTLLTFGGAIIAAAIILGAYTFITRPKTKVATIPPKVSSLNQADLSKLNSFFSGDTAGSASEVLTVSSSSLFNNRVAINSDLKVVGGVDVSGTATLANLSVAGTSTFGVTTVRGALTVAGPVILQSPADLTGGATVNGNVTSTGNGTFGGSLSAGVINTPTISVTTINLSGHLNIVGQTPSASPNSGAGAGASASVTGNDTAGTVTVTTGSISPSTCDDGNGGQGELVAVNFQTVFPATPRILITAIGEGTGLLPSYIIPSANNFLIGAGCDVQSHTSYSWNYWAVQ